MLTVSDTTHTIQQLLDMGVSLDKIVVKYAPLIDEARIMFLYKIMIDLYEKKVPGSVAEVGVYKGDFSKKINYFFPDKQLYLFDSFEGFSTQEVGSDHKKGFIGDTNLDFTDTSIDLVMSKMSHPTQCIIKKGYFPGTAEGIVDTFCFVSLDCDLYDPIWSGLEWFYPRMEKGGVILVHDYYNPNFLGTKKAVDKFCERENVSFLPVGDYLSVAIRK